MVRTIKAQRKCPMSQIEKDMDLINNTLVVDNISEALYEIIEEGHESCSVLVCEIVGKHGQKYQAFVFVTQNENDFIDNKEGSPVVGIDDQYRLIEIPPRPEGTVWTRKQLEDRISLLSKKYYTGYVDKNKDAAVYRFQGFLAEMNKSGKDLIFIPKLKS